MDSITLSGSSKLSLLARPEAVKAKETDLAKTLSVTAEKISETKVAELPAPRGGIPSIDKKDKGKTDIVDLSPEAKEILKKHEETKAAAPNVPAAPQGPGKIAANTQHLVNGFLGRIQQITNQFDGLPKTEANLKKMQEMLEAEGVSERQLRVTKSTNSNAPVNAQGKTIYEQFMQAYNVSWASDREGTITGAEKIDGKVEIIDKPISTFGAKEPDGRRAPGLQAPQGKVVGVEKIDEKVELIDRPTTGANGPGTPTPPALNPRYEQVINGWLSQIRDIVSQFSGKEQSEDNMKMLETMLGEAGVSRARLRPTDPNAPAGTYTNAAVGSNGLTIAQMFDRAYSVNWAS